MSVRGRRLSGTGTALTAVCAALIGLTSPAAGAVRPTPFDADPVVSAATAPSTLLTLEMVTLRPLTVLREPGEPGAIIAHRGDSSAAPENTLPALSSSAAVGSEYLEVDIRVSKDGVPIVIHDSTVDRTTDGTGVVAEMTFDQLRALDAGSWFDETFAATRIPTLDEVLAHAAEHGTRVLLEYKGTWKRSGVGTTMEMIEAAGLEDRVIAQSFSAKTVANISDVAPDLPVGWLVESIDASVVATARTIGADAVNPTIATAQTVAMAHRAGLGVFVWTHDADADWEELTAMGVDGIVTNRPEALQAWMSDRDRASRAALPRT